MRLNYVQEKVAGIISLLKPKEPKEKECEETCDKVGSITASTLSLIDSIYLDDAKLLKEKMHGCSFCSNSLFMDHFWFEVEVGRTPSMQCHNQKVADVCTTEYKDTTVGFLKNISHE